MRLNKRIINSGYILNNSCHPVDLRKSEAKLVQTVIVKSVQDNKCTVWIKRESACGGNCSACEGCGKMEFHTAQATNRVGAKPNDVVVVESENRVIFKFAAAVYLLPVFLMMGFYLVGALLTSNTAMAAVAACVGFAGGIFVAVMLDRATKNEDLLIVKEIIGNTGKDLQQI